MFGGHFEFIWNEFRRSTWLCSCLDCWSTRSSSESSHSALPDSWERLFAPCKCSFIKRSTCGVEGSYIGADGIRWQKYCPSRDKQNCRLRILYINHITGESTVRCPCATCCPDWRGVPCVTLASLFGEVEPTHSEEAPGSDPMIPAQDLTRAGKPCWRLGDLFEEDTLESLDLDDDPVIPAQDVGLDIFDDMPGFALARNHLDPMKRTPSPALTKWDSPTVSTPKIPSSHDSTCMNSNHLPRRRWTFQDVLAFLTELRQGQWSFNDILSFFTSLRQRPWTLKHLLSLLLTTAARFSTPSLDSLLPSSCRLITVNTTPSTPFSERFSTTDIIVPLAGFILSTLLVILYECIDIYIYLKTLPPPPRFLCRLGALGGLGILVGVGIWGLSRG